MSEGGNTCGGFHNSGVMWDNLVATWAGEGADSVQKKTLHPAKKDDVIVDHVMLRDCAAVCRRLDRWTSPSSHWFLQAEDRSSQCRGSVLASAFSFIFFWVVS